MSWLLLLVPLVGGVVVAVTVARPLAARCTFELIVEEVSQVDGESE